MPPKYPVADHSTPRIDSGAAPSRFRKVQNAQVIEVDSATHRGSKPFAGVFELVAPGRDPRPRAGKLSVEVYCAWHGVKPLTCHPNIHILGKYKLHAKYTGKVVDNIS